MRTPPRKRFSFLKTARKNLIVLLKYGTFSPTAIHLPGCGHLIQVDPTDERARNILVSDSVRGKVARSVKLWRTFNKHLQPDVAVDVGVNYGECLLGTTYGDGAQLFGCEANPRVFDFLRRSLPDHPNRGQMTLHNRIISDRPEAARTFYVDPTWSGNASAVAALHAAEGSVRHEVPVDTLDRLLPRTAFAGTRLLFKIDIEGYERKAMQGFAESLAAAATAAGIIEFDSHFLKQAGDDPEEFLNILKAEFLVLQPEGADLGSWRRTQQFAAVPTKRTEPGRVHTDLLLIKPAADLEKILPPGFTVVT